MDIDYWRNRIDELDERLVELLNERAKAALAIGRVKRGMQTPIYDPDRERQVLEHVMSHGNGPLSDAAIRRLFERIIDENRRLERELVGETTDNDAPSEVASKRDGN